MEKLLETIEEVKDKYVNGLITDVEFISEMMLETEYAKMRKVEELREKSVLLEKDLKVLGVDN